MGKNIVAGDLKQALLKLRSRWQCRQRRDKQLLVISISQARAALSCWQADCALWQKECELPCSWSEDNKFWWQELEQVLREELTWARVNDMVDTMVLLDEVMVYSEVLSLPELEWNELRQAAAWEAEQLVPWEKDSYVVAFAFQEDIVEGEQLKLWAWPKEQLESVQGLGCRLRLKLTAVLADAALNAEDLQQLWFAGVSSADADLLRQGQKWQQTVEQLAASHYPRYIGLGCLALAVVLYGCSVGGRYLAEQQLQAAGARLAQYTVWQRRYDESQSLEKAISYYRSLEKQLQQNTSRVGEGAAYLGQQVGAGCWLELLRTAEKKQGSKRDWQLKGVCYDAGDLSRLMERLEQSTRYAGVQLRQSEEEQGKLKFELQVKEK